MAESEVKKAFIANIKETPIWIIAGFVIGMILIGGICLCCNINDEWISFEKGHFIMKGTFFVSIIIICLAALLYGILYYYHNKKHRASKEYYDFLHHLVNAAMELEKAQQKEIDETIKEAIKEQLSKENIEKAIKKAIKDLITLKALRMRFKKLLKNN